jgi:hypothetical protein
MNTYTKINTIYKRDMEVKGHPLIDGAWSEPEFEYLANCIWTGTEKIDGTNTRIQFTGNDVQYKGKTDDAQYFPGMLEKLQQLFPIEKLQTVFPEKEKGAITEVCLYGETYGKGIQSVGKQYRLSGVEFILFDVKIGKWWLQRADVESIAFQLNVDVVPVVFRGTLHEAVKKVRAGYPSLIAEQSIQAEGMIMFPETQLFNRKGDRIITKLKYKDFK